MSHRARGAPQRAAGPQRTARHETDVVDDEVVCRHCHEVFRTVAAMHLRHIHDYPGPHPVEDYKARYGLRVACSRATSALMGLRVGERARRNPARWTNRSIATEIKRLADRGKRLAPSRVPVALYEAARRVAGGWQQALRLARIEPFNHMITDRWSRERVVQAVRGLHRQGRPLTAKRVRCYDRSLYGAAIHYLGNWSNALRAAGLDPARHREPQKWNVAMARAWIRERLARGRPILVHDVPRGLLNRVERDTGMRWPAFVESTGRRYPGLHRTNWTPALVLEAIRDRRRRRRPLDFTSVGAEPGTLARQGLKHFGSWEGALRAAGVEPALAGGRARRR